MAERNTIKLELFPQQAAAFNSKAKMVGYFGGIQSGKTTIGAVKTVTMTRKYYADDDTCIVTAPDYKMLHQATLPKLLKYLKGLGEYRGSLEEFKLSGGGTIYFRTCTHPDSVEGITNCRFIWGDESGKYTRYFFENLQGRSAFKQCQIFLTSTHYAMNWQADLVKQVKKGARDDVFLTELRSVDNPFFPKTEYDRQRGILDPRRFAMKYEGLPGEMEGLVYPDVRFIDAESLPPGTRFFGGIDWGFTDPFVITIRALCPNGTQYRVAEFYKSGMISTDIVKAVKARHELFHVERWWADPSRPDYIEELLRARIPVSGGDNAIRKGIDAHTELMRKGRFYIFEAENPMGCDEYQTYHYPEPKELKVDDNVKETDPVDANNHGCDADRYITLGVLSLTEKKKGVFRQIAERMKPPKDGGERLEWLKRGGSDRIKKRRETVS
jgi:hypothetical protein